jgi:preprotein translocase subunit YajC
MDGVSIYPMISLLIFVIFFIVVLYYVIRMTKAQVAELSNIPNDNNELVETEINQHLRN